MFEEPHVIIDFPALPRRGYTRPGAVLQTRELSQVRDVIAEAERAARGGRLVAGFVAYEAAPAFDAAMQVRAGGRLPLAWFAVFDGPGTAVGTGHASAKITAWRLAPDRAAFRTAVERIRAEIAAGRTYQVNFTARFRAQTRESPLALYETLRRTQGGGYHALIDTGEAAVLCASPELFFDVHGRRIRTRPMKGTRPRGRWAAEDAALARELAAAPKDHAENLMIVDMLRSDVGRVANIGTVEVRSLFDVETYRTVHQLTSTIEAELRDDVGVVDVFAALFPCGSVTGAPKISTMQLIAELEDSPREVYCGAVGMIEPGGNASFAVPIRTVCIDRVTGEAVYGTGAGITFDSDADAEYAETLAKAAIILEAWPEFELLETMRAENGTAVRCERHIARLLESARYFGIAVTEAAIRESATGAAAGVREPARLRLLVDAHGRVRTEVLSFEPVRRPAVALAGEPVPAHDRFLFHKTSHRRTYERQRAAHPDCWDVLLWNEQGEITEFTRGNVVVEIDGQRLTPPRVCGLLAGIFRAQLLESGAIREQVVRREDIARAERIWLISSLREWVEVVL